MMITLVLLSYFIIMEIVYKIKKVLDLFLPKICPISTRFVIWFWSELVHLFL